MEATVLEKEKKLTAAEYLSQERKGIREKDGKHELLAEHYVRMKENEWKLTIYQEIEDSLPLLNGKVSLTLKEVYKNLPGITAPTHK